MTFDPGHPMPPEQPHQQHQQPEQYPVGQYPSQCYPTQPPEFGAYPTRPVDLPPPAPRSTVVPVAASIGGALLLAGIGIGCYVLFGPQSGSSTPAAPPAQTTTVASPAPAPPAAAPPRTVRLSPNAPPSTVYQPAGPPVLAGAGGYDSYGAAVPYACASDGVHLYSTVSLNNTGAATRDFIGTLEFVDSDGDYLGEGGFSAVNLAPGDAIDAYVDTGDPNDPRASEGELSGTAGPVGCVVTDLHSK